MSSSLNEQLMAGIKQHSEAAHFYRTQGEQIEQSRQQMRAEAQATGQQILSQLTPLYTEIYLYVDGEAADGGDGTSARPFNTLEAAFAKVPANLATYIELKGDQTYTLAPGRTSRQMFNWINASVRIIKWGDTGRPTIRIPHYDNPDNGRAYPTVGLNLYHGAHVQFQHVDIELLAAPKQQPTTTNTGFIYPLWGCVLRFNSSYSDITVPPGYALITPYVTTNALQLQIGYGTFSGGGDIVRQYSHQSVPASLQAYSASIAQDTFFFSHAYSDRRSLITNYTGDQLMRDTF